MTCLMGTDRNKAGADALDVLEAILERNRRFMLRSVWRFTLGALVAHFGAGSPVILLASQRHIIRFIFWHSRPRAPGEDGSHIAFS